MSFLFKKLIKSIKLDEHGQKRFPTLSNSLQGEVGNNFLGALPQTPFYCLSSTFLEKNVQHKINME